ISQRPLIRDEVTGTKCKNLRSAQQGKKQAFSTGTNVRIEWGRRVENKVVVWPFGDLQPNGECSFFRSHFRDLVEGFAVFNPHATITLDWFGEESTWNATTPDWHKWKPCKPTSPHWYEPRHLERLLAAYIAHDRDAGTDRLVSDLLKTF